MSTPIFTEEELEEVREQARREVTAELEAKMALSAKGPDPKNDPDPSAPATAEVDYGKIAAHNSAVRMATKEVSAAFQETFQQDLHPDLLGELELHLGSSDPDALRAMLENPEAKSGMVDQLTAALFARGKKEGKATVPKEIVKETDAPTPGKVGMSNGVTEENRSAAKGAVEALGRAPKNKTELRIGELVNKIKAGERN